MTDSVSLEGKNEFTNALLLWLIDEAMKRYIWIYLFAYFFLNYVFNG